jgi:hypothetical protein
MLAFLSELWHYRVMLKLKDFQLAKKELERELKKFRGYKSVTVGIHEGAGDVPDGNINMATLGAVLNFGTDDGHIPARPWLEPGVASGTKEYLQIISNGIKNGESLESVLDTVGIVATGKVQEFMTELSSPANAASTIKAKGADNPLIDEGHLRASVTYQVTSDKLEEGLS